MCAAQVLLQCCNMLLWMSCAAFNMPFNTRPRKSKLLAHFCRQYQMHTLLQTQTWHHLHHPHHTSPDACHSATGLAAFWH